ncbi:thioredoxin domain-containing protein [Klebsormidium nitens]|uniref:Thioredoxin domain-containing protein n=1 Tax=Klebsormidium nitens TaxID=105231 RepID=A0A1Y1HQA6_KLENI|nr:thioredoxin domain-containing protein [Klebsormidium nitens]|eukprot:GAQ80263.1 thioredoxin domain-containing protein [Klebsormidium nitens]
MANHNMDPDKFRGTMSDMAFGTALQAAARDYKKELLAQGKGDNSLKFDEVDMDDLEDDPELEKLHADRIAALKRESEKRASLQQKGHGEYKEIEEAEFLAEVTGSERVVCHFYHHEFERCKIVDKHLRLVVGKYFDTKFIKVDAEKCPFFVTKLGIKVLPCVILFKNGVAIDRIVGFEELGGVDDFATVRLERRLERAGVVVPKVVKYDSDDEQETKIRTSKHAQNNDSDSD